MGELRYGSTMTIIVEKKERRKKEKRGKRNINVNGCCNSWSQICDQERS